MSWQDMLKLRHFLQAILLIMKDKGSIFAQITEV